MIFRYPGGCVKKNRLAALAGTSILVLSFQNCAPQSLRFDMDSETAYRIDGELPENAKVAEFQTEESVEYPSTQLVLVVDNSQTMKQSQEELVARIDGLLASLATKKVTVQLMSTSSYLNASGTLIYGSLKTGSEVYVNDISELAANDTQAIAKTIYGGSPQSIVLDPRDSASVRQARVDSIKKTVLNMGTAGSDNESALCSIIQWATNKYQKPATNEKVVFFVLTDEDNYQGRHCMNDLVYNYDRTMSVVYKRVSIPFTFTAVGYRDGVSTNIETRTFYGYSYLTKDQSEVGLAGQNCQGEDLKRVQNTLAALKGKTSSYNGVNFHFNETQLIECKYTEVVSTYYVEESEGLTDYCSQAYRGHANIMAYLASAYTGTSATQACKMTGPTGVRRGIVRSGYLLEGGTDVAANFLSDIAKTALHGNYFMAVVGNTHGQSCELKVGQSYVETFERLQNSSPGVVQTYSLCQDDDGYKKAFDKIASSVSYVSQEFPLEIPEGMKIRDVLLKRKDGSAVEKVKADQYDVADGKIKISLKLAKGDKLTVIVF